jgi:endonuclease YncB( thermonuclease family)
LILAIALICTVAAISDGDTWRCTDRTRIRLAGVNARELHGDPCPRGRPCPAMPAREAKATLERMILGKTLRCQALGTSYKRIVASCTINGIDIRCRLIASGAVADWERYRRAYGLRRCG